MRDRFLFACGIFAFLAYIYFFIFQTLSASMCAMHHFKHCRYDIKKENSFMSLSYIPDREKQMTDNKGMKTNKQTK